MRDDSAQQGCLLAPCFQLSVKKVLRSLELVSEDVDHG